MKFPVAVVGVGNMGGALSAHLLEQGWPIQVFDIETAKVRALERLGAVGADSAAQAVHGCCTLIVCVVDAAQTDDVLFGPRGAAPSMKPGDGVLLCPTIAPRDVEELAARLAQRGIAAVDAPMSGGPARARDGSMSLMVACPDDVFDRAGPLLAALSRRVFRISQHPGDGARTKLVNNLLAAINLAGAAEVLAMAQRIGLDPVRTLDIVEQSSGQSWIASDRMRRAIAGDYAPRAHVTLLQKDTRLALDAARAAGCSVPLGACAHELFNRAVDAGFAALDDAALFKLLSQHGDGAAG